MMNRQLMLIVLGIALLILVSCAPPQVPGYGKAIAGTSMIGPVFNAGSDDLRDFPAQFLFVDPPNQEVLFRAAIMAPTGYSAETAAFESHVKSKMCSLLKSQGYDCVDTQGNQITGGAIAGQLGTPTTEQQLQEAIAAANKALQDFQASVASIDADPTTADGGTAFFFGPHLKCYNITEVEGPDTYPTVEVTDQFGIEKLEIIRPRMLCTPADKRPLDRAGTAPSPWVYTDNHFKCYDVKKTEQPERPDVKVTDQFGIELLSVLEPEFLCAPAAKWHENNPKINYIKINFTTHYKCYNLTLMAPELEKPIVHTEDQFGNETLRVLDPLTLCTPALKEPANPDLLLQEVEGDHLLCYNVSVDTPLTTLPVSVWDQFGPSFIELKGTRRLCTPAQKKLLEAPEPQPDDLPACGNGVADPGEQCGEPGLVCPTGQTCANCQCQLPTAPVCGNGILENLEQCDDGNTVSGDGCDANCQKEFCGDGIVQQALGEQCEQDSDCSSGQTCVSCACQTTALPGYTPIVPTSVTPTTPAGNAVAIGTCDDNHFIASQLGTTTCNSLRAGDALIRLTRTGNYVYLIIAGKTKADAQKALSILYTLDYWDTEGKKLDIIHNEQITSVGFLRQGNNIYTLEYKLKEGQNFIGSPYKLAEEDIQDIFVSGKADIHGIFKYNPALERKVKWHLYRPDVPSDLHKFGEPLEAYRIHMKSDATLLFKNAVARSPSRTIPKATYVGYSPSGKKTIQEAFGNNGQYLTDIKCWNNGQLQQLTITQNPVLELGKGCFIKFSQEVTI